MEKWKFFTLPGLELPLPLVVQPVASRYTDWAIPAPTGRWTKDKVQKPSNSVYAIVVYRNAQKTIRNKFYMQKTRIRQEWIIIYTASVSIHCHSVVSSSL
jgi:hypothetical protein